MTTTRSKPAAKRLPDNPTKQRLLRTAPAAKPVARPTAPAPRNKAKLDFESLVKLRTGLREKTFDRHMTREEMDLLRELNQLPASMPKATKSPGTTDTAYNKVWNTFTASVNAALPAIQKRKAAAGIL